MKPLPFFLILSGAIAASLLLSGCNVLEGIHQFSPGYQSPVPFSENWWDARKAKNLKR